jgi:predicted acylesterase/phospholipase RssA
MNTGRTDLGLCLAGGGNRSFWQIGMLDVLGDILFPRVAAISACSAGAAAAVLLASDSVERARRVFAEERKHIRRNFDVTKLFRRERPLPHERVYRTTLRDAIGERGLERIRSRPFAIRILSAEPPPALGGALGLAAGLAAYQIEKLARPTALHPTVAPRLGFRPHIHDARDCRSLDDLVDLVLASSATPPFTKTGAYAGARLLDGSLIDNAPAFAVDELPGIDRSIVLLTRPYPASATGARGNRLYLAPTVPVPAHRWDYRASAPIDDTIVLGRRDAEHHRAAIEQFLADGSR